MKLRALLSNNFFARRLRKTEPLLQEAAAEAAAAALHDELKRGTLATLSIGKRGIARLVGSAEASDVERELGTLAQTPSPWLAPALPLALEPMRAAAKKAVARAISASGKRKK